MDLITVVTCIPGAPFYFRKIMPGIKVMTILVKAIFDSLANV